jgi:hypothetical protein
MLRLSTVADNRLDCSIVPKTIAEVGAIQVHVSLVASRPTALAEPATYVLHNSELHNHTLTSYYSGTVLVVVTFPGAAPRAVGAAKPMITADPATSLRTTHPHPHVL